MVKPRAFGALAVALALCLLVGGCWDYREIDQRAFVIILGFDRADDGRYLASAQIAVTRYLRGAGTAGGGAANKLPYRIVSGVGVTPQAAFEEIRSDLFREVDLGHTSVVIFGEELAGEGLEQFDWIRRSFRLPNIAFLGVAHGRAETVVSADTPAEELPGLFLFHAFSRKYNRSPDIIPVYLWEGMVQLYLSPFEDVYLQGVTGEKYGLNHSGLALFSRRRLVGWLTETQAAVFGRVKREYFEGVVATLSEAVPGKLLSMLVLGGSRRLGVTYEGGQLTLSVSETISGNFVEAPGIAITSPTELDRLQAELVRQEEADLRNLLQTMQSVKSDALGFGELLRRRDPASPLLADPDTWREAYSRAAIRVQVKVEARNRGFTK